MSSLSSRPRSHAPAALLAGYALGELPAVSALLVACHLTFCAACREEVHRVEEAAGASLEDAAPATVPAQLLPDVLARLDATQASARGSPPVSTLAGQPLPRPLGHWLARQSARAPLAFRTRASGVASLRLHPSPEAGTPSRGEPLPRGRLLLFRPGLTLPLHRHRGEEHTLVLAGGFTDRDQRHARGDVASARADEAHAPRVDDDGPCLVLLLDHGPLVGSSPAKRLLLALLDR